MKTKIFSRGILIFLTIVFFWGAVVAQEKILLHGYVKGVQYQEPKRYVSVLLEGPKTFSALTNSNGEFFVADVVPGRYFVTVRQGDNVQQFSVNISQQNLELFVKF